MNKGKRTGSSPRLRRRTVASHSFPPKVPYMGWNTYFGVGGVYDEKTIREVADALVDRGLAAAGYNIVWLDWGWASGKRDANGDLIIDSKQWPGGMKGLTDYLHSRGLLAGIYSDAGPSGGNGHGVGSMGHYQRDADAMAEWGFDAIKIDFVGGGEKHLDPIGLMSEFARAVRSNASRRPMLINICNFWMPGHLGNGYPPVELSAHNAYNWAPDVGDSWRTETDIGFTRNVVFGNVLRAIDANSKHPEVAAPGKSNDPDYLVPENGLSDEEFRTQLSMWAMMASPLIIGSDVRTLTVPCVEMLTNAEVLAINQDALALQGTPVRSQNGLELWVKRLADGDRAIALLNRTAVPARIAFNPSELGLARGTTYTLRDLWSGTTTTMMKSASADVPAHGTVLYRVSGSAAGRALAH